MEELFALGVECLKEEGVFVCLKKTLHWFFHYIWWKRIMIRNNFRPYMRKHFEWYDRMWMKRFYLKQNGCDGMLPFRCWANGFDYARKRGLFAQTILENEETSVVSPQYFEGKEKKIFRYICPPIYVAEFKEADIYGGSNLISVKKTLISDICVRDQDERRYDIWGGEFQKRECVFVPYKKCDLIIEKAILMTGIASYNYYHFTFEIISRLAIADRVEGYRQWPILIDQRVLSITQLCDLLKYLNLYEHEVIAVNEFEKVRVKNLLFVSPDMWMPVNFNQGVEQRESDFLFSRFVVDNIRNRILEQVMKKEAVVTWKKIFLSRKNCKNQRLVNADIIEKLFADNGFHVVYPEELSLDEEVILFHEADVIVGPTGAAFTNIVYCKKDCFIGIIMPETYKPYFFSNIAHMVGVRFMLLAGDTVSKSRYESMDQFCLDTNKCKRFLDYLRKEGENRHVYSNEKMA